LSNWGPTEIERSADACGVINILCLSPLEEDHAFLEYIVNHCADARQRLAYQWAVFRSFTLESALKVLQSNAIPVVVCECASGPAWKQLLDRLPKLAEPPHLILASRLADDRLWAEALNLGAYDLLAKPFDATEVLRVLNLAWLRWSHGVKVLPPRGRPRTRVATSKGC